MRIKKISIIFIFICCSIFKVNATGQIPDILYYNGDTLSLFANPLELFNQFNSMQHNLFGEEQGCITTACWREYVAEWELINGKLFLLNIYSCCYYEDSLKADLKSLFEDRYVDGKVKADWVTGEFVAPKGELIYYVHMGYESIYEKELEFKFEEGNLINIQTFVNSKSKVSEFESDPEKLKEFLYSNIRWNTLPKFDDEQIKIFVQFSANEEGQVDSVEVMKGFDSVFDNEAVRVLKLLTDWTSIYKHGEFYRATWNLAVIFSEENMKKYKNKD